MASLKAPDMNINANAIVNFALKWIFAAFWAVFGWNLGLYVFGLVPWPHVG